jgi:hypothetical protein
MSDTTVDEIFDNMIVYDGDDSFGKEYQKGYNDMALAARLMKEELKFTTKSKLRTLIEEIIGEDEYSGQFITDDPRNERYMGRDDLRASQRAKLDKMFGNKRTT